MTLHPATAAAYIKDQARLFRDALHAVEPEARVAACPGWTAADLAWHLAEVHSFWAAILSQGVTEEEQLDAVEATKPARPSSLQETLALGEQSTTDLAEALQFRAPQERAWFWGAEQSVASTVRMQLHEVTIHRVDAELAAGQPVSAIDAQVAADGIAHAVEVMWAAPQWSTFTPGPVVELLASDTGRRWLVQTGRWQGTGPQSGKEFDEPGAQLAVPGGEPSATVSAPLADLYTWLWGRTVKVERSGDDGALAAFDDVVTAGMP